MAKQLVYFDNGRFMDWQKSISKTVGMANNLIDRWNKVQRWSKITDRDSAIRLLDDPVAMLDQEITTNVNMATFGKVKPDLNKVAEFVSIDRPAWQISCKSYDTIDLTRFLQVERFTTFEFGKFKLNAEALNSKKDSYSVFAENEKEQANYKHLQDLVEILNSHLKRGFISTSNMQVVCGALELPYTDNKVYLNDFKAASLIKQL